MRTNKPNGKEFVADDLDELESEELSGAGTPDDTNITETDEDDDEGLGDGNMSRSDSDPLKE